jgi:hypothetical protein
MNRPVLLALFHAGRKAPFAPFVVRSTGSRKPVETLGKRGGRAIQKV